LGLGFDLVSDGPIASQSLFEHAPRAWVPSHQRNRTRGQLSSRGESGAAARRTCNIPCHEIGIARNKVSSRGSSKPSPMQLPVASKTRGTPSGTLSLRQDNGVLREDFLQPLDFILQTLAIRKCYGQSCLKVALIRYDSARRRVAREDSFQLYGASGSRTARPSAVATSARALSETTKWST
jgi:hypothetical protein